MHFFDLFKPIYYLLTYLPIDFKNNNPKHDFNLGVNLTQSNGPLSMNQIDNHFVRQTTSQMTWSKLITLSCWQVQNQLLQIYKVVFLKPNIFLLENLVKKTMNYSIACEYMMHFSIFIFFSQFFMYILQLELNHSFNN
jgi:hypothetical protein